MLSGGSGIDRSESDSDPQSERGILPRAPVELLILPDVTLLLRVMLGLGVFGCLRC